MPLPNIVTSTLERLKIDLRESSIFNSQWYRAAYRDLDPRIEAVQHFLDVGLAQGRSPNPFMDLLWYAARYPDVRGAGADPFLHYLEFGWREGRDPGPWFSSAQYLAEYPDLRAAEINPLIHFLEAGAAQGRFPLRSLPVSLEICIRGKDQGSAMVHQWTRELTLHGVQVLTTVIDAWPPLRQARLRLLGSWRANRLRAPLISVNGAALTPSVAKAAGRNLIALFDDVAAARSVQPELRDALSNATVATTSSEIAKVLAGIPGSAVFQYAEPMSGSYLQEDSHERAVDIVWRCPSPHPSTPSSATHVEDRLAIVRRLSPHGLLVVGDAGWRGEHPIPNQLEVRSDWATSSCARRCYGSAKLSIVTPLWERDGEVTSDLLIALASGTLPVAPFSMATALFARFGDDCPVALYKDVDELVGIAAHYLREKDERAALVERCRKYLFSELSYSALVGEVVAKVALREQ